MLHSCCTSEEALKLCSSPTTAMHLESFDAWMSWIHWISCHIFILLQPWILMHFTPTFFNTLLAFLCSSCFLLIKKALISCSGEFHCLTHFSSIDTLFTSSCSDFLSHSIPIFDFTFILLGFHNFLCICLFTCLHTVQT